MLHRVGRPPKFETVEVLELRIQTYFDSCYEVAPVKTKKGSPVLNDDGSQKVITKLVRPLTITGLALALGTTRETLLDYQGKPEFSDTIKWAKTIIECFNEESLYTNNHTAGIIFNLTNNFKWTNKTEVKNEHTGSGGGPLVFTWKEGEATEPGR